MKRFIITYLLSAIISVSLLTLSIGLVIGYITRPFYRSNFDNLPSGINEAYQRGLSEGYHKGLNELIDYSKLTQVSLDGGGLIFPSNYGILISSNITDGYKISFTKNPKYAIDLETDYNMPVAISGLNFTGAIQK